MSAAPKGDHLLATRRTDLGNGFEDGAGTLSEQAVDTVHQLAEDALDGVMATTKEMRRHGAPLLRRSSAQAGAMVQDGVDALRDRSRHIQASARGMSDRTLGYIRQEPVKSLAMAAVTGAVLMALFSLINRPRNGG